MPYVRCNEQYGILYAIIPRLLLDELKKEAIAQRRNLTQWVTDLLVERYGVTLGELPPQRVGGRPRRNGTKEGESA